MPEKQYARGLWGQFTPSERPFDVPNGMEDNLRLIDDHLGLYTLEPPLAPGAAFSGTDDGDGQIYTDGTYAVRNAGVVRQYPPRKGLRATLATGTESWLNIGAAWEQFTVLDTAPAVDAALAVIQPLVEEAVEAHEGAQGAAVAAQSTLNIQATISVGYGNTTLGETYTVLAGGADGLTRATTFLHGATEPVPVVDPVSGAEFDSAIGKALQLRKPTLAPLFMVGGSVLLAHDNGALDFDFLSDRVLAYLAQALGGVATPSAPIATNGGTLRRYRSKTAKFRAGVASTQIRVGITGDSWAELSTIPAALVSRLNTQYAQSASGLICFSTLQQTGGVVLSRLGSWTLADMTPVGGRSLGPDGSAAYTTATDATMAATGIRGTQITFGYWNGNGTFRYRIDGGAWVPVAGTGANVAATVQVSGLSAGPHTLDIDTSTNGGTVELYFALAEAPATSGVALFKFGNGGSTGLQWTAAKSYIQQWSALLALDLLIVILGTNDTRASVPTSHPATLAQGIADIVEANRSANAALPVIYMFPPIHGEAVGPETIEEYRAAAEARCTEIGIECYRSYAEWDDYATENARGMWADTYHLSVSGGERDVAGLQHHFLGF